MQADAVRCEGSPAKNLSCESGEPEAFGSGASYWDAEYLQHPKPFEWLRHYADLAPIIAEATAGNHGCRILHVGCGNSMITERMYDAGYRNIVNIDVSSVVVAQMRERNLSTRSDMRWLHMDATCMDFEDRCFDLVLDKSLIDTLACTPSGERAETIASYMREVMRVLRPGGIFLSLSLCGPTGRRSYFELPGWELEVRELPDARAGFSSHFLYRCRHVEDAASTAETSCT
eukprot:gnl/TRDRNA2_/TRDRNA2_203216_c0_seq1.p1 gnl/TRDRNA2_/TRDRNA2_203216_c0~~gnl/TRDRNA2_/TRDRNA2_203216_c0_seq1.p1  ORF type:complete len:231 (-),score=38.97 gnl/TRDRNA2_/TRDRNA2_203216_c0_seq1:173-865(-)